ncbi:MAG: hypothetical protein ACYCV7_04845 [Acidimicrobiales bacterium]
MAEQTTHDLPAFDDGIYEQQCEIASFWTASRLVIMASLFLYGTFTFAYFYLRELNNHNDWRVGHQHPSVIIGTVVAICVVGAAAIHYAGARRLQYGARSDWIIGCFTSLVLLALGAGLGVWELTRLPFFPASSGYSSIVVAWMPIYLIYILGTFYWLETLLAQAIARPASAMVETPDGSIVIPKFGAKVEGFISFSGFMVVVTILIWVLFYLI